MVKNQCQTNWWNEPNFRKRQQDFDWCSEFCSASFLYLSGIYALFDYSSYYFFKWKLDVEISAHFWIFAMQINVCNRLERRYFKNKQSRLPRNCKITKSEKGINVCSSS